MSASALPPQAVADAGAAVRDYLRLGAGGEDAAVARAAAAALSLAEAFTRQALIERAHEDVVPASSAWARLVGEPVTAIGGVTALPVGAAPVVLAAESYAIDIDGAGRGWVRALAVPEMQGPGTRLAVSYRAGLAASWAELPPAVAQGVTALAAHLHDDRTGQGPPPAAVAALLRPWRRISLGEGR